MYTCCSLSPIYALSQTKTFFETIYPEDYKGGSVVLSNGHFRKISKRSSREGAIKAASKLLGSRKDGQAFTSANLFFTDKHGVCRRGKPHLFGINHIVFDLDVDFPEETSHQQLASTETLLTEFVLWEGKYGDLPMPNLITYTGSGGIHLYYCFERLPRQMFDSIQALKWAIAEKLVYMERELIEKYGLSVRLDTGTFDVSRMDRIPGGIHPETGRMCICHPTEKTEPYKYLDLVSEVSGGIKWKGQYVIENSQRHIERLRDLSYKPFQHGYIVQSTPAFLAKKRTEEIFRLAKSGYKFVGCRERAIFFLRVWGKDLNLNCDEINHMCKTLNSYFHQPLVDRELFRTSNPRRSYKFKNSTIRNYLCLSSEDRFFRDGMKTRKNKGRKQKTFSQKSAIAKLVCAGKKIREIAHILGVSISLVKRRRAEMEKSEGFLAWVNMASIPI